MGRGFTEPHHAHEHKIGSHIPDITNILQKKQTKITQVQ